ncbi:MAG TPA: PHP domain-containing protein, partial [Candidatus Limnocylindria bacterium]|nr:PHP domain-containing protein [Candidatus Limnocylindria bacterium]
RNSVDLHTHTLRSDGVLAPAELYAEMSRQGLRVAAITDHDTLAGYRELRAAGRGETASEEGPQLIPAVEINSVADRELIQMGVQLEEGELHILGFGVDPNDATFEQRLESQRGARRTRLLLIIDALRGLGAPIDEQIAPVLKSDEALGRPHIARAMVAAGHVASVQEAFDLWIDRGGPAYVPRQGLRTREAVEAIADAGGVPVLAHYPAAPEQPELIRLLIGWGLRGLEVHYRRFLPETVGRMAATADSLELLATGGSDYHGDLMSYAEEQATTWVPASVGDRLLATLEASASPAR